MSRQAVLQIAPVEQPAFDERQLLTAHASQPCRNLLRQHLEAQPQQATADLVSDDPTTEVAAVVRADAGQRVHPDSLLRGLLRCAGCRYVLKRLPDRLGRSRWRCRSIVTERGATHDCAHPAALTGIEAAGAEGIVVERFLDLAAGVSAVRHDAEIDMAALQRAAQDADALLDELSSLELRRQLGAQRWSELVSEARVDRDAKHRALAQGHAETRTIAIGDRTTLAEAWEGMPLGDRQAALRSIVHAIMVTADRTIAVGGRVHVIPVWTPVEIPRRGQTFTARAWVPGQD